MSYTSAIQDFHRARRRAGMEQIMARLTGKSVDLLSYEEVRKKLRATAGGSLGLHDIPIDAIVGSVGRYRDFTRSFLPRHDGVEQRWARVQVAVSDLAGLDPIEVYQIGDAYFVLDGNHRVSVARSLGATHIQAYVTEIRTGVPLSPDVQPDDLILKAEYAEFLERTGLDGLRPAGDLSLTVPGQYQKLLEHIEVHRHFMGLDQQREIPYGEAVGHWYDAYYLPLVQAIRERDILRDFPGRTETDLYLWVLEHRATLEEELGWEIETEAAADDLASQFGEGPVRIATRDDRLFANILVPISGQPVGWHALEQALEVARREGARLRGLHVVPAAAYKQTEEAQMVQAEFDRRCTEAGVRGRLAVEVGPVARKICERARWADLVVVNLAHPPASQPIARLNSGFRALLRHCRKPVLAVPGTLSALSHMLLAYDGSPKAQEALCIAAYLAGRWQIRLSVLTILDDRHATPEMSEHARAYLETHEIQADFLLGHGSVAERMLETALERGCDLLLMGGYGYGAVLEVMLGSTVDQVLRASPQPTLICR